MFKRFFFSLKSVVKYLRPAWILLIFGSIFSSWAADEQTSEKYLVEKWTTEQGLPQNTVTGIVQTMDGYIWLGTFGGLVRFDGIKFTVFNTVNAPALKNQRVNALYEDREGTLWIGSDSGDVVRYRDGKFQTFEDGAENNTVISAFFLDSKNYLWVGTRKGVARYSFNSEKLLSKENIYLPLFSKIDGANLVSSIGEDSAGNIWLATREKVFCFQNGVFREFSRPTGLQLTYEKNGLSAVITDLNIDSNGVVRIATTDGILRVDGNKFVTEFAYKQSPEIRVVFSRNANFDRNVCLQNAANQYCSGGTNGGGALTNTMTDPVTCRITCGNVPLSF